MTETVSGSVATAERRGFARLLDRLEAGDVLAITKLDGFGCNAMDMGSTVARLAASACGSTAWRRAASSSPARPAS